jgi:hypothetical protein
VNRNEESEQTAKEDILLRLIRLCQYIDRRDAPAGAEKPPRQPGLVFVANHMTRGRSTCLSVSYQRRRPAPSFPIPNHPIPSKFPTPHLPLAHKPSSSPLPCCWSCSPFFPRCGAALQTFIHRPTDQAAARPSSPIPIQPSSRPPTNLLPSAAAQPSLS